MPKIKSAKKELRKSSKRNAHNLEQKTALREVIKKYKKTVAGKKLEEARSYLPHVYQVLDKAAKVNLIKKNKASRLKSRLASLLAREAKA